MSSVQETQRPGDKESCTSASVLEIDQVAPSKLNAREDGETDASKPTTPKNHVEIDEDIQIECVEIVICSDTAPLKHAPYTSWRWLVLLSFMFNCLYNGWVFVNFCSVTEVTRKIFNKNDTEVNGLNDTEVNGLYGIMLAAVVIGCIPGGFFIGRNFYWTSACFPICSLLGGWVRYASVLHASYAWAMISSIFFGFSAATMDVSFAVVCERWFPVKQRSLAVSLAVGACYFGWGLGAFLTPEMIREEKDMTPFMLYQAIIGSVFLIPFGITWREDREETFANVIARLTCGKWGEIRDRTPEEDDIRSHKSKTTTHSVIALATMKKWEELRILVTTPSYLTQGACCAVVTAASYSVPGFQDTLLRKYGYDSDYTQWSNAAFITSGAIVGTIVSATCKNYKVRTLCVMFFISAASLTAFTIVCMNMPDSYNLPDTELAKDDPEVLSAKKRLFGWIIGLFAINGGASLGFIGTGLIYLNVLSEPVCEAYSGTTFMFVAHLLAAVFSWLCDGQWWLFGLMIAQWAVTILFVASFFVPKLTRGLGERRDAKMSEKKARDL